MDVHSVANSFKLAVYFSSYAYFPAAILLGWAMVTRKGPIRFGAALVLAALSVPAYARFVEPRLLHVRETKLALPACFEASGKARLVVFSDMHIGLFGNAMPIERIARRVSALKPDAVLIPGDFTYFLPADKLRDAFRPLASISAPVYGVMGNHDVGFPGWDVGEELSATLGELGLTDIDNQTREQSQGASVMEIIGLSDLWQGKQERALIEQPRRWPRLVLTHNPDTLLTLGAEAQFDLMITGHTHGGQINFGPATCALVPMACRVARAGLATVQIGQGFDNWDKTHNVDGTADPALMRQVFVTTGTGMVGLPMRFNMVPRIDVVSLEWSKCEAPPA